MTPELVGDICPGCYSVELTEKYVRFRRKLNEHSHIGDPCGCPGPHPEPTLYDPVADEDAEFATRHVWWHIWEWR